VVEREEDLEWEADPEADFFALVMMRMLAKAVRKVKLVGAEEADWSAKVTAATTEIECVRGRSTSAPPSADQHNESIT
jgi:hypothetical protein